jgi:hypothetical protein
MLLGINQVNDSLSMERVMIHTANGITKVSYFQSGDTYPYGSYESYKDNVRKEAKYITSARLEIIYE